MKARSKSCCTLSSMCIYLSMDVTVSYVLRAEWSLYEYLCIQHFRYILFIRSMNIVFGCALCVCVEGKVKQWKPLLALSPINLVKSRYASLRSLPPFPLLLYLHKKARKYVFNVDFSLAVVVVTVDNFGKAGCSPMHIFFSFLRPLFHPEYKKNAVVYPKHTFAKSKQKARFSGRSTPVVLILLPYSF